MPNDINWEDEDQSGNTDSFGQIDENKTIKALRAKIKADETKFAEQQTQLEELANKERERTVKEILEKKGANPKVARLALKDLSEVTDENVDTWLKDNAEALNIQVVDTTDTSEDAADDSADLTAQDALTSQAVSPGTGTNLKAKIDSFKTFDEIQAWANSLQK